MVVFVRLLLTLLGGVAGYQVSSSFFSSTHLFGLSSLVLVILGVILGAAIGFVLGGVIGRQVLHLGTWLERATARVSVAGLALTAMGLILGLGVAALASLGVKDLPVVGVFLSPLIFAVAGYAFAYLSYKRHTEIARLVGLKNLLSPAERADIGRGSLPKVLDTSVIIDGRIGDIVPTHFVDGDLVIPNFVLEELQSIADSGEPLKRARGRRGLDCVAAIQEGYPDVVIADRDFPGVLEVDAKLIKLAKEIGGRIVTTDYNLNKLAQIQGVDVLNVNELANALKPVVLPGESLDVRIIREGREEDQGVAYLDDGTMVVIEGGRGKVGQEVSVEVTSVLQNPSGKMVFTRLGS
jgi:uncharacterized protein YacL